MTEERYTVGQAARMAHVTVRALHHYDEIGLLRPSARGTGGYRLYSPGDLERLHQIVLLRQLDFPLAAIGALLAAPETEPLAALREQRRLLTDRRRELRAVVRAVDAAIAVLEKGVTMDKGEMFKGFGDFDPSKYDEEARERWGSTAAYAESKRRTRKYTKDDLARINAEADEVWERMKALMTAGRPATDPAALQCAEEHRLHIDRWFYPCSHATHAALAEMYTADARFTEYFEKRQSGLTLYVQQAIAANAVR